MKHKYLFFTLLMMGSTASFAQQSNNYPSIEGKHADVQLHDHDIVSRYNGDSPIVNAMATADTLWYSDMENPADWTFNNQGTDGWQFVDEGSEDGWYLASLQSTSGGKQAELYNGDPTAGAVPTAEHIMVSANPIDVSGLTGGAVVMFQQRAARFLDEMYVEVSNNGTSWTTIGSNEHLVTLTALNGAWTPGSLSNPEYMAYHVPASISGTGNNSLWVRFRWSELDDDGIAYGWLIDDVVVYRGATNDLDLTRSLYLGITQDASYQKYSKIPALQGENADFILAAAITNQGEVAQSNVVFSVSETNSGYTDATTAFTLNAFSSDTVEVASFFQPTGTGNYSLTYDVTNGSAEWIDINNNDQWDFEVTDNTWSYTDGNPQSVSWYGSAGYSMCLYFDNFHVDTIRSINVYFPTATSNNTDVGLKRGDVLSAVIYNDALDTIIGSEDFYTIPDPNGTQAFVNGWQTIPVEQANGGLPLSSGRTGYYACFSVFQDEIPFGLEIDYPNGLSFVDPDNAGTWFNPITTTNDTFTVSPMIEVNTTDPDACDGVNINISGVVTDILSAEPFTGTIELTVTGNGTAPLSYSWNGPGTFSETNDGATLTDITNKGDFTVTVSDINGCKSSSTFTVAGNVSVNELTAQSLNIYPNPANDVLTIGFGVNGNFNVDLVNLKGEVVSSRQVNASVGNNVNFDVANFAAGVYVVKVYNDSDKVTKEIVIK